MSYTEHYKGTMTKLYGSHISLEEQLVTELDKYGLEYNGDIERFMKELEDRTGFSFEIDSVSRKDE